MKYKHSLTGVKSGAGLISYFFLTDILCLHGLGLPIIVSFSLTFLIMLFNNSEMLLFLCRNPLFGFGKCSTRWHIVYDTMGRESRCLILDTTRQSILHQCYIHGDQNREPADNVVRPFISRMHPGATGPLSDVQTIVRQIGEQLE